MPYRPHTLMEFGGALPQNAGAPEIWACGIRTIAHNEQLPAPDPAVFLPSLATALASWFAAADSHLASNATLTYLKLNNIGADGRYSNPGTTFVHNYSGSIVGADTPRTPSFCSIVTTFETDFSRGPAHRGRIYLPNFTAPAVGAQFIAPTPLNYAQAGEHLLVDVLGVGAGESFENYLEPWVMSKIGAAAHPIVAVSCDNVYDVQRRRKNKVQSTRSAPVPLDYTP